MNVAQQGNRSRLIKHVILCRQFWVCPQVEFRPRGGGENVMADIVAVRRRDLCTSKHGQNVRNKGQIDLIQRNPRWWRSKGLPWKLVHVDQTIPAVARTL